MSAQVTICKKPGMTAPTVLTLNDNEFTEVLVYGDGTIKLEEIEKPKTE